MDSERDIVLRVEKFNGRDTEDFALWQMRLMAVLEGRNLSGVVLDTDDIPQDNTSAEYLTYLDRERKAKAIIITALGNKPLRVIQSVESPSEMWVKLGDRFAAATTANKIAVLSAFMNKRYESGKDMGEYLADIETLFNKLAAMGMALVEPMQVAILLVSISSVDSFQGTVAAIKTMEDHKATWDYVSGRLIEEQRTQKMSDSAEKNDARVQAAAARTAARRLANTKCFKCNKKGHIPRNCRSKVGEGSGNREGNGTTNVRAAMARSAGSCTSFIVDSGASQHIANDVAMKKFRLYQCILLTTRL